MPITEKVDRWLTTITAVPVFGAILKMAFDKLTEKGAEKLTLRVEKILGFSTEDAQKSLTDEIIYALVVSAFSEPEQVQLDSFEVRLRKDAREKAQAYVLFVAQMVSEFVYETKKTISPAKGQSGPSTTETLKNYDKGIECAKSFLGGLLRKSGANEDETFKFRAEYLEGKNVFSLIKPKKGDSPLKAGFEKAKTAVKDMTAGTGTIKVSTAGIESLTERIKRKRAELASKRT